MKKGQFYIVKPMALVMTIIVLFVLFYSLSGHTGATKKDAMLLDTLTTTTNTLLLIANSHDCLAYEPENVEEGVYGSVIDMIKADQFNRMYQGIEPECARSYLYGWRAEVTDLMNGNTWTFGATGFSERDAFALKIDRSIPVAIRYSGKEINPARLSITLVDGELERVAGLIDYVCRIGQLRGNATGSAEFFVHYPIIQQGDELCQRYGEKYVCRETMCRTVFEDITDPGEYAFSVRYSSGRVIVET